MKYLRHYWSDNAGLIRAKLEVYKDSSRGVGLAHAEQAQCAFHRSLAPGADISAKGDLHLVPDQVTKTRIPYLSDTYRIFGDFYDDKGPWALCPRGYLKSMVREAEFMGYQIRAAFEPEFYLLSSSNLAKPIDDGLYCDPTHLDSLDRWTDNVLNALEQQGIAPECFHHESGPGQYEIAISHSDPISAADNLIVLRDTIKAVSTQYDMAATFCPKPFLDYAGSGLHLNIYP